MTRYEDNDDRKFKKKGQTAMKHRILQLYLNPWLKKLSTVNSELLYVDGFAGPGIYPEGSDGSPIIAMDMADKMLSESKQVSRRVDAINCIFIEADEENYKKLENAVEDRRHQVDDRIEPACFHCMFEDWAADYIDEYTYGTPPPSLIFIDPFGYGNIPFQLISELFQLRQKSLELLITFMAGKMAQWMEDPDHKKAISATLGTTDWTDEVTPSLGKDERAEQFSSIYQRQLKRRADANFTMPFEMVEEAKRQTCYYLIHVTNHWEGLKVMKETMFNAGADDEFAYLGPDHAGYEDDQLSFTEFGDTDEFSQQVESFAEDLHTRYQGEKLSFQEILEGTLDENVFKLMHYRDAFQLLKEDGRLEVEHRPHLEHGNKSRGFGRDDLIHFVDMSLESFL